MHHKEGKAPSTFVKPDEGAFRAAVFLNPFIRTLKLRHDQINFYVLDLIHSSLVLNSSFRHIPRLILLGRTYSFYQALP